MAGGKGTRLRPVTSICPKPMIKIMDKPVLGYILELLKRNGITDVCMTLGYMPEVIKSYVKGENFGLNIETRVEKTPLGTAGGVKGCADFIGEEDFLVISGDGICDFDLKECIAFHKEKNAEVTIVLYSHPAPTEYGLVVTNEDGRIERFIEKPSWDAVCTDCINTGIYIISAGILREIPDDVSYDFGKDLFPKLLEKKRRMYGIRADGYWCDIGGTEAYLQCCADILQGKGKVDIDVPRVRKGVWSGTEICENDVLITPPVYIGKNASLGKRVRLGPNTVIGDDSVIGNGAYIGSSIIDGASIGENASVSGSILCRGVSVGRDCVIEEGTTVGEKAKIGDKCFVFPKVKIWQEREIPAGTRLKDNVVSGMLKESLSFGSGSTIGGEFNIDITPSVCTDIGAALSSFGKVGIGSGGGSAAIVAADAISCGIRSSGGEAIRLDSPFPSALSFSASVLGLSASVFVKSEENSVTLMFFDGDGRALPRDKQRKIEASFSGDMKRANGKNAGTETLISGSLYSYIAGAASNACGESTQLKVSVSGGGAENRALKEALLKIGCVLSEKRREIPSFAAESGGFQLSAIDERGRPILPEKMLVLTALAEFENGCGVIAVPYGAPAALDILARDMGAKLLRLQRDGDEAERLYKKQIFMRDGIFAAVKICSAMQKRQEALASLLDRLPSFSVVSRDVRISGGRGEIMKKLALCFSETAAEFFEGLHVKTDSGTVSIKPNSEIGSIRISAEGESAETAEELCCGFERMARKLDLEKT